MRGLQNSRWAPSEGRSSSVPTPRSRPSQGRTNEHSPCPFVRRPQDTTSTLAELARYSKIVRRMKWKLPFLDLAYRQATLESAEHGAAAEAELMFKLDFFEYYMLCERALVHLQGVYGITISRGTAHSIKNNPPGNNVAKMPTHRYHANVLEALDRKDNPLHDILGVGDVRRQLGRAKDLRNHWKNADEAGDDAAAKGMHGSRVTKTDSPPLASYDLATILASIHEALDRAFIFTRDFVENEAGKPHFASEKSSPVDLSLNDWEHEASRTEDWDFMVEAMDWEAV